MQHTHKWILLLTALGFILAVVAGGIANAAENETVNVTALGSTVIVSNETEPYIIYPPHPVYRIQQGQNVWLNDTIDISGMGWGTGVAWYGTYGEYNLPLYVREFKNYRRDLMNFYIDPAIFIGRTGVWYQYYGNATEKNGNLAAFKVMQGYRNSTLTFSNGTIVNQSVGLSNTTGVVYPKPEILPEKHVADYLLAIGDPLVVKTYGGAQVWVFGRVDQEYEVTPNDNITFAGSRFQNFEPGSYTILVQNPGKNTEYDVRYVNKSLQHRDGWNGVFSEDVSHLQPRLTQERLIALMRSTDDTYTIYSLEIQQPSIIISTFDEVGIGARQFDFAFETGLITLMDVRGYTNMVSGSKVVANLDKGNSYIQYSDSGFANRTAPGNMSIFQVYIPLVWDNLKLGMHTITVEGPHGSIVHADFPVEQMPADSFRPNATLKYAGSRNPWVPTPTPQVITKIETKVVTQIVTVPVTPSPEVVLEQQQKAMRKANEEVWATAGIVGLILLIVVGLGLYARSVYRRAKK